MNFSLRFLYFLLVFLNIGCVVFPQKLSATTPNTHNNTTTARANKEELPIDILANISAIIIASFLGIISNGLLLVVLIVDPLRCLRNLVSSLIMNLCVADFLTATMIFIWSTAAWDWIPKNILTIIYSSIWLGYTVSFLTITLLSCERYVAIRYLWSSDRIVTKKKTLYAIATIWIISSTAFVNIMDDNRMMYIISLSAVFEICIFCVVVFYVKLWNHRRRHAQQENTAAPKRTIKLTKVVFLLLVVVVVTTLPLLFTYQLFYFNRIICDFKCSEETVLGRLPLQFFPIFTLNFVLNPFIYGWRLSKYRRSFFSLFSVLFQRRLIFKRRHRSIRMHIRNDQQLNVILTQFTSASCASI